MLWKGFYHDFSTKKASASGGFPDPHQGALPPGPPPGELPPGPPRFPCPLTIYPGAAPVYICFSPMDKYMIFGVACPFAYENFAFGELKMLNFRSYLI